MWKIYLVHVSKKGFLKPNRSPGNQIDRPIPLPSRISWVFDPPTPLEFQFPPWLGYGYFLQPHIIDHLHVTSSFSKIQNYIKCIKSHESFYPHRIKEAVNLYLFAILKLDSVLHLETRAFWISELWQCVTQGDNRVCWKIYPLSHDSEPFAS